jgi:hypothetical protein
VLVTAATTACSNRYAGKRTGKDQEHAVRIIPRSRTWEELFVPRLVADGGEPKPAEGGVDTPDRMARDLEEPPRCCLHYDALALGARRHGVVEEGASQERDIRTRSGRVKREALGDGGSALCSGIWRKCFMLGNPFPLALLAQTIARFSRNARWLAGSRC